MEILAVVIGVETFVLLALLGATAWERQARASAWRRIAEARRVAACFRCPESAPVDEARRPVGR